MSGVDGDHPYPACSIQPAYKSDNQGLNIRFMLSIEYGHKLNSKSIIILILTNTVAGYVNEQVFGYVTVVVNKEKNTVTLFKANMLLICLPGDIITML